MGITTFEVEVGNSATPAVTRKLLLLVDSGAIYSVVPAPILHELGVEPYTEQVYRLANGEHIARKRGAAFFRYGERVGAADVIFGEAGDYTLLGAFTLESLGLALDPLKRELRPIPMLLAALCRSTNEKRAIA